MRRSARRSSRSGNKAIFSLPAGAEVFKIGAVRRDEQLRAKKSGTVAAKLPGYVGLRRFDLLHKHSVRQKNRKPWLGRHCFRMRFVNLNLDVAGLHAHVAESPLPHKDAKRIKRCRDAASVE